MYSAEGGTLQKKKKYRIRNIEKDQVLLGYKRTVCNFQQG